MTTNDAPFRFTQEGNLSILTLLPELNNVQWGEIDAIGTQVLSSLESQAHPQLIVDLSPLSYMGSAMVALIVRAWKATQPKKGKICVVCPHAGVKEVLKLAALDKVWDIVDDMAEARSIVGASRGAGSSGGGSSSGAGVWIIGLILLIACGALVAFAVKPGLFGIQKKKEEAPASQPEAGSDNSKAAFNFEIEKETAPAPDQSTEKSEATKPETGKESSNTENKTEKKPEAGKKEADKTEPVKPAASKPETKSETKPNSSAESKPEAKPKPESKPEPK